MLADERVLFYKALKKELQLEQVISENCFGCIVNHPSQRQHDLCLMSEYGEQVFRCYEQALSQVSRPKLMETLIDLVQQSDTIDFMHVFKELFIQKDPLEQIKYDSEMQLEFVSFLLDENKVISGTDRNKIYSICHGHDYK